jgi:hypothetical protein
MFPPYVPGAGMILDRKAVSDLYYGAQFLEHIWIDDAYLGIVAYKMGIVPLQSSKFHSSLGLDWTYTPEKISELLIMHGFECSSQALDFWNKREFKDLLKCSK